MFFIFVIVAIVGSISVWHWWDAASGAHNGDLAYTLVAAKNTHTLFAHEAYSMSACPPEDDCYATGTVQTITGVLYAYYDHAVEIGTSAARCVAVGPLGNPDLGVYQQCETVYTFTGEGNVTAGTITSLYNVLLPEVEGAYLQTVGAVTGGTGPYKAASGGAVSMVISAGGPTNDLAFTDVVMVTA
jgi:hypothetical protein